MRSETADPTGPFIHRPLADLRAAFRSLSKSPVFALLAVLTLALGIGVNTAIFSVMNGVLLRYLPVPEPERVVHLRTSGLPRDVSQTGSWESSFSGHTFERLREARPRSLSGVVAHVPLSHTGAVAVRFGAQPETADVTMVSGNFFTVLGVRSAAGRTLLPEDEEERTATAVLGHTFWSRRFGGDPSVVGETLHLKGLPFTIVGVAASGFDGISQGARTDVWIPLQTRPELGPWGQAVDGEAFVWDTPHWWFLRLAGRLAPEVSREKALAELSPIFLASAYPDAAPPSGDEAPRLFFASARGAEDWSEVLEHPLTLLMAMVGLVLVIACTNVVLLILARNRARRGEIGLRIALGASRWDLFRQLLSEGLLLVGAGGILGWLFAVRATALLGIWAEIEEPLAPDATVLAFTLVVCSVVAVVFGLVPMRAAAAVPAGEVLASSGRTTGDGPGAAWRGRWVVGSQMALCLALLVGAGLLVRSLVELRTLDLGLDPEGLVVFGVHPQGADDVETRGFYRTLLDEIRGLPGVESVTLMGNRIGSGWSNNTSARVDGAQATDANGNSILRWNVVGPAYFETLEIPLLQGRDLRDADTAESPPVAVVNRTFAETYLPDADALGHTIALSPDSPEFTIVGVAADSKYTGVRETTRPMAYLPYAQVPGVRMLHVEVRTSRDPVGLIPELRKTVGRLDPELPLIEPRTQAAQFERSYSETRLFSRLSLFFGGLAALLVAVGLYGTLSHRVARRTVEIGVRMALGAQRRRILWMILRESLLACALGLALGLPLAAGAGKLLESSLFGLEPTDPATFVVAVLGLVVVALGASLAPARRAASVEPLDAIRHD